MSPGFRFVRDLTRVARIFGTQDGSWRPLLARECAPIRARYYHYPTSYYYCPSWHLLIGTRLLHLIITVSGVLILIPSKVCVPSPLFFFSHSNAVCERHFFCVCLFVWLVGLAASRAPWRRRRCPESISSAHKSRRYFSLLLPVELDQKPASQQLFAKTPTLEWLASSLHSSVFLLYCSHTPNSIRAASCSLSWGPDLNSMGPSFPGHQLAHWGPTRVRLVECSSQNLPHLARNTLESRSLFLLHSMLLHYIGLGVGFAMRRPAASSSELASILAGGAGSARTEAAARFLAPKIRQN